MTYEDEAALTSIADPPERTTMTQPTDYERAPRAEIAAIRRIVAALDKLDTPVQERIVRYLMDRYWHTNPVATAMRFDEPVVRP